MRLANALVSHVKINALTNIIRICRFLVKLPLSMLGTNAQAFATKSVHLKIKIVWITAISNTMLVHLLCLPHKTKQRHASTIKFLATLLAQLLASIKPAIIGAKVSTTNASRPLAAMCAGNIAHNALICATVADFKYSLMTY